MLPWVTIFHRPISWDQHDQLKIQWAYTSASDAVFPQINTQGIINFKTSTCQAIKQGRELFEYRVKTQLLGTSLPGNCLKPGEIFEEMWWFIFYNSQIIFTSFIHWQLGVVEYRLAWLMLRAKLEWGACFVRVCCELRRKRVPWCIYCMKKTGASIYWCV